MKPIIIAFTFLLALSGQTGTPIQEGAPLQSWTTLLFYNSSDLQYVCKARSQQATVTFGVSASTPFVLTNIVVLTNVGTATTVSDHGLNVGDKVIVSGGTVDTDLNATYSIVTVPSTKTFTITTVSVSNATYNNAALQFTTTAPRDTAPIWSIQKLTTVATQLTAVKWANGTSGPSQICANRASLAYN